ALRDNEGSPPASQDVAIHQFLEMDRRRDGGVAPVHHLRDRVTGERNLQYLLLDLSRGRAVEEPADKGDPQATAKISPKHLPHAPEDKDKGDRAACTRGDQRRLTKISGGRPEDSAEDPASVQGEAGDEIKQRQRSVDIGEILDEGK